MRSAVVIGMVAAAVLLVGCGSEDEKPSVDLTFFQAPTVNPTAPVDGQSHVVAWTVFNADQRSGRVADVLWRIERDGVVVGTGTIPSIASRERVPLSLSETLPPGTYQYVIRVDPADTVAELNEADNGRVLMVVVLPLSVM